MTLAHPNMLWALLMLPLLWWLSQPPKPRQQVLSAHLQQWRLAMRALRRRPPRGSWLRFALLAIATLAATLAAARPFVPATAGATRLVVLLDASASMAARVGDHTAFDLAKQQLRSRFIDLPEHIEVTVLRCGGDLRRRHGEAARALHDLGPAEGSLQVDLVALAEGLASADCAVWTLTDGQGQTKLPTVGALTHLQASGTNAAIAAVRFKDAWPLPPLHLEVDVVAYALPDENGTVAAQLQVRGATTAPQQLDCRLVPGAMQTVAVDLQRTGVGGELLLELVVPGDRLPADNLQALTLPALPAPRIAALAEADAGTFAAVAADALAEEVGGVVVALETGATAGMMLVDGGFVPLLADDGSLRKRRALTFGTRLAEHVEPEPWFHPTPIDWSRTSPLTIGLDLSELRIDRAWRAILPPGEPFLWQADGEQRVPLAVMVDGGATASMHFSFRLQDSNLPLLPAFPQLLRRAFVRSYGVAATSIVVPSWSPADERDLLTAATGADRALPEFAAAERDLARWLVLTGLLALALRAFVR